MFTMPYRDSGVQDALWSPGPAEFPLLPLSHSALPGTDPISKLFKAVKEEVIERPPECAVSQKQSIQNISQAKKTHSAVASYISLHNQITSYLIQLTFKSVSLGNRKFRCSLDNYASYTYSLYPHEKVLKKSRKS